MANSSELTRLGEQGKRDFEAGRFAAAADEFRRAVQGYAEIGDPVNEAEQKNNLSVAMLQMGKPQQALDAAAGTDEVFAANGDRKRQGMALNNQAAALEELGRDEAALDAYERAAQHLAEAGEGEMQSKVLKAAAAIQLRRGRVSDSGISMIGALGATPKPTLLERVLRFLLRFGR